MNVKMYISMIDYRSLKKEIFPSIPQCCGTTKTSNSDALTSLKEEVLYDLQEINNDKLDGDTTKGRHQCCPLRLFPHPTWPLIVTN